MSLSEYAQEVVSNLDTPAAATLCRVLEVRDNEVSQRQLDHLRERLHYLGHSDDVDDRMTLQAKELARMLERGTPATPADIA